MVLNPRIEKIREKFMFQTYVYIERLDEENWLRDIFLPSLIFFPLFLSLKKKKKKKKKKPQQHNSDIQTTFLAAR